jgi:hypothetical protein
MPQADSPTLGLAIANLTASGPNHYAIWVLHAPWPGGLVHHDCVWNDALSQLWQEWQSFFSLRSLPAVPHIPSAYVPQYVLPEPDPSVTGQPTNQTSRLMQSLGVYLWQWLFSGKILNSFAQSQGIAIGQNKPLRLRLDIRDPSLIALPWEIMQPQPGTQAVSLSQQILFSRSTSAVAPLPHLELDKTLRILLVLGDDQDAAAQQAMLSLNEEASMLKQLLENRTQIPGISSGAKSVPCQVDTLIRPSPAELTEQLEHGRYTIFFYAGHGIPAPDGGLLFPQRQATLNGTELAQVLTRCRVKLAVFNACWGALPDQSSDQQAIPRSSLAEVLIHHGVPAVIGMRDSIADQEALSFIQVFAQSLAERKCVDEAVAIARQHLLTLYRFNQPAWTLPVLYMHPEFNGQLVCPPPDDNDKTLLPGDVPTSIRQMQQRAMIRLVSNRSTVWPIREHSMRIGRQLDNDLVIEDEQWVSRKHARIVCRHEASEQTPRITYSIQDFSKAGTHIRNPQDCWQRIHHQEVVLQPGAQIRFGSTQGKLWEFIVADKEVTSS